MKKSILLTLMAIVAILAMITEVVRNNPKQQEKTNTIKIGVSLGLTGNLGVMGQSNKVAVIMAKDAIAKMYTKYNYEFIIEDDAFDNKRLTQIMNKFVNLDKTLAVITSFSKGHKIAKVYGDREEIINMGCSWGDTIGDGKYNFNGYTRSRLSIQRLLNIFKEKGIKDIGIISTSSPGGVEMLNIFREESALANMNLIYDESFLLGNTDFSMVVGKMNKKQPEIIFFDVYAYEADMILKEMKIQNIKIPVTTIDHFPFLKDLRAIEGNWFISYLVPKGGFQNEYESRTDIPMQICVPQIYNNIMILVEAFENSTSVNISDVADYINNMKEFKGVSGTLEIGDSNFNQKESPIAIIKNGQVEVLK